MTLIDPRIYAINERIRNIKRIWAVGSGKGGVGKSTLSTFISLILNKKGYRVGLLDLDFYGPSSHIILGLKDSRPEEEYGIKPINVDGIEFMSIVYFTENKPLVMRGKDVSAALIEILTITHWSNLDFLIIDMPPGMGEILLDTMKFVPSLEFLIVSNSSIISMETVEKLARFLKDQNFVILGLIENMKFSSLDIIKNKCNELEIKYLGEIPFCPELEDCYGNLQDLLNFKISRELDNILSLFT